jgi:hypothetical protein
VVLLDGFADKLRRTGFTLSSDNCGLFFLTSFVNNECSSLSFLLSNLLGFNCSREFRREVEVLVFIISFAML